MNNRCVWQQARPGTDLAQQPEFVTGWAACTVAEKDDKWHGAIVLVRSEKFRKTSFTQNLLEFFITPVMTTRGTEKDTAN